MTGYPEPLVARVTGIHRSELAAARRSALSKETDWQLVNSVVTYTPPGLKKLLAAKGLDSAALAWPEPSTPQNPSAHAGDPAASPMDPAEIPATSADSASVISAACESASVELIEVVVSLVPRNPTIVYGIPAGAAAAVLVRVRDNANFLPGMKLKARAPAAGTEIFHMVGHCPRWRGRF